MKLWIFELSTWKNYLVDVISYILPNKYMTINVITVVIVKINVSWVYTRSHPRKLYTVLKYKYLHEQVSGKWHHYNFKQWNNARSSANTKDELHNYSSEYYYCACHLLHIVSMWCIHHSLKSVIDQTFNMVTDQLKWLKGNLLPSWIWEVTWLNLSWYTPATINKFLVFSSVPTSTTQMPEQYLK
jgi:hypothetical protein